MTALLLLPIFVRLGGTALQHRPIRPEALPDGFEAEPVEPAERGKVGSQEGTVGHVEVFRMGGVGTTIIGRPRPYPANDAPTPTTPSTAKSQIP